MQVRAYLRIIGQENHLDVSLIVCRNKAVFPPSDVTNNYHCKQNIVILFNQYEDKEF